MKSFGMSYDDDQSIFFYHGLSNKQLNVIIVVADDAVVMTRLVRQCLYGKADALKR